MELRAARQVCDVANEPILVADIARGQILHANPAASELLGYSPQALLEKMLPDLHSAELRARSAEIIADVWEKKGLVYSDLPFVRSDGTPIEVEVSAKVIDYIGRPAILIYARDIRDRRRAELKIRDYAIQLEKTNAELRETQAQLVQSEKMASLGNLAAGVAHEINNPIGAIHSNVDVTARALALIQTALEGSEGGKVLLDENPRARQALETLVEVTAANKIATVRIRDIVKTLRNFARLDEAELKRVDLHEGIESTLTLLKHELGQRIRVVKQFGSLPEIECHPNQLNQVFMNLLANATQAIEGEGVITIVTRAENGQGILEFRDTGKGIKPENLGRIFDPGFTTKGVGVGSGLGLSISYRIVERHQGSIDVSSTPGEGSIFTVRLPLR